MSSTSVPTALARRSPQWRRSTTSLLTIHLARAAWFATLALVVIPAVLLTISRFTTVTMSGVQFAFHGALWFQFAMAIAVFVAYLPVHVARGMTRRSFIRGTLLAGAVTSVLYAGAITTLLLLERWIYDRLGWFHGLDSTPGVTVLQTGLWPYLWGGVVIFAAGTLSGLIVAAVYYRVGGWRGTLALPLTLAPLLLISVLTLDRRTQWTPWDLTTDVLGVLRPVLAVVVIVIVAGVLAYHLLVRRMPISTHAA